MGVSDTMLGSQRRSAAAATCSRACGADLDLTLVVADGSHLGAADPAFEAHVGVVYMWALAVWEQWVPIELLCRLVARTAARVHRAKKIWSVVYGPAAALIATLSRTQWQVQSAHEFITDNGMKIDLKMDSPAFVKGALTQSVERWRWKNIECRLPALCSDGNGRGAWWKPIASVLRQPDTEEWGPAQKGALKSAIMGRQWPQQRLFQAGLVEDAACQLCCEMRGGPCTGTLLHRLGCPALKEFVRDIMPEWMEHYLARTSGGMSGLVGLGLTRGVCPAPRVEDRDDEAYDTFHWHAEPVGDTPLSCRIFTDGSLLDGAWKGCEALGWAYVVLDSDDKVVSAAYGVPPRWVDSIQGAELWAVQVALATALFPQALFTDCQTVSNGVRQSREWAQSAKRRYARIWSVIHSSLDEEGAADAVHWMPAHTGATSVGSAVCSNGATLTEAMRCANEMADLLAKKAAGSVRVGAATRRWLKSRMQQAKELAIFVARLTHRAGAHPRPDGATVRDSTGFEVAAARRTQTETKRASRKTRVAQEVAGMTPAGLFERSGKLAALRARILERIRIG